MIDNKNLEAFINMGTYKLKYVFIRVFITSILSISLIYIAETLSEVNPIQENIFKGYLISVLGFNSITELNILFINLFRISGRFHKQIYLQILVMLSATISLTYSIIKIAEKVLGGDNLLQNSATQIVLILGLLILLIHLLVIVLSNLTKEWMNSKKELSDLKQTKLISDYNSLKDRLNPHFLFNNLSVLKSLIHYSPNDAEVFIQNFTNVYRYVLNSHEKRMVTLENELKFIHSYIALHKERIGEGLNVSIDIEKESLKKEITPMSLQLLIENAIKHNIANKNQKLKIDIFDKDQYLIVKNNINKKETTYSTQTGLNTLKAQYKLIANKNVIINDDGKYFMVKIPLL
jgi:sensor histidine kinase YesM